jgi:uncharacterized protein YbaR (Trm112 family)
MAVNPELLEILLCPVCVDVHVVPVNNGTGLKCSRCHRVYPVRIDERYPDGDIPVMLPDEAVIEPPSGQA